MTKRIAWIDTAKFLGVFLIYLFHTGGDAGYAEKYVLEVCVQLFFLLAGFSERLSRSSGRWKECLLKNVRKILVPYFLFGAISIAVNCIEQNTYTVIADGAITVLKGTIRGSFYAAALWFLTCLFVVRIGFFALRNLLKTRGRIMAVSLLLFVLGDFLLGLPARPLGYYNVDSAIYHMAFYAAGYCSFDAIRDLFELDSSRKRKIFLATGAVAAAYSMVVFFGKYPLQMLLGSSRAVLLLAELIRPLVLSYAILVMGKLLEDIGLLCSMGQNTLYFCGSEFVINRIVFTGIQMLGLRLSFVNTLAAYIYVFVMLVLCHYTLVPVEKSVLKKLGC